MLDKKISQKDFARLQYFIVDMKNDELKKELENGLNPSAINESSGCSLLMIAAEYDNTDAIMMLVKAGANIEETSTEEEITALGMAICNDSFDSVDVLLNLGADINKETQGLTPVMLSCLCDNYSIASFLVARGANVLLSSKSGLDARDMICFSESPELHALINDEAKRKFNYMTEDKRLEIEAEKEIKKETTLMESLKNKDESVITNILIHTVTNLNFADPITGDTPLALAIKNDLKELTFELIKAGADVEAIYKEGDMSLTCYDKISEDHSDASKNCMLYNDIDELIDSYSGNESSIHTNDTTEEFNKEDCDR